MVHRSGVEPEPIAWKAIILPLGFACRDVMSWLACGILALVPYIDILTDIEDFFCRS